jgi:Na+/alanine symporter
MGIANVIGLYMLMPKVKALLNDYNDKLASGEIRKVKQSSVEIKKMV